MSSDLNARSEVGVVLQNAPRLEKAFGRFWGVVLTWKALSVLKPRGLLTGLIISIASAALGGWWKARG